MSYNTQNYAKGQALEYPTFQAYYELLSARFSTILIENNPSPNIERIIYASYPDPQWTVKWYRPNQGTKPAIGSRPDFEVYNGNQLVQTTECKNVNQTFQIYNTWFDQRIASRFTQPSTHRLLIISQYTPYPIFTSYLNTQVTQLNLDIVTMGKQVTAADEADVRNKLLYNPDFTKPF